MRKCYLPCDVLLTCCLLKTSWKDTGKYTGKIKNLSSLATFSSFWNSVGHIVITNDNPVDIHNPACLVSEFLRKIFWGHKGGLNSSMYYSRSIIKVIKFI